MSGLAPSYEWRFINGAARGTFDFQPPPPLPRTPHPKKKTHTCRLVFEKLAALSRFALRSVENSSLNILKSVFCFFLNVLGATFRGAFGGSLQLQSSTWISRAAAKSKSRRHGDTWTCQSFSVAFSDVNVPPQTQSGNPALPSHPGRAPLSQPLSTSLVHQAPTQAWLVGHQIKDVAS